MSNYAISVRGLGKRYMLGATVSHGSIREAITQKMKAIGGRNNGEKPVDAREFWALKDVEFDIPRGDIVGVVGRNGAGKSTLLKILSRITAPTTGEIRLKGRVNALLEVGTGFHPELSGRENIFLNGAILGMQRSEIRKKFDSIVDFSGVERFLDTPVKRYSSGMYVRLAFAVAAHLEPEILLVDEVLAVGDAQFQERCLGRMKEVCEEGRTVVFVSHQMGMVAKLCTSGILMTHGQIQRQGPVKDVIADYLHGDGGHDSEYHAPEGKEGKLFFRSVSIIGPDGEPTTDFMSNDEVRIRFRFQGEIKLDGVYLGFDLQNSALEKVFLHQQELGPMLPAHGRDGYEYVLDYVIPPDLLTPGEYLLASCLHLPMVEFYDFIQGEPMFRVTDAGSPLNQFKIADWGAMYSPGSLQLRES